MRNFPAFYQRDVFSAKLWNKQKVFCKHDMKAGTKRIGFRYQSDADQLRIRVMTLHLTGNPEPLMEAIG